MRCVRQGASFQHRSLKKLAQVGDYLQELRTEAPDTVDLAVVRDVLDNHPDDLLDFVRAVRSRL